MGRLSAGSLNRKVTFQRKTLVQNDWGQPAEQWTNYKTVKANVRTVSGAGFVNNEMAVAGTQIATAEASIRIRKRTDIDGAMRILFKGRIYDIRAVLPDEVDNEYLDVAVSTGANQG